MVRAAVHSFARRAATVQPRHIRRGDGKVLDVESSTYNNILQFKPNPTTTAYKFYYRLAAQYKLYNNAFAYPVWNEATGRLEAIYNINAQEITLLDHEGELFCKFRFNNGKSYISRMRTWCISAQCLQITTFSAPITERLCPF